MTAVFRHGATEGFLLFFYCFRFVNFFLAFFCVAVSIGTILTAGLVAKQADLDLVV